MTGAKITIDASRAWAKAPLLALTAISVSPIAFAVTAYPMFLLFEITQIWGCPVYPAQDFNSITAIRGSAWIVLILAALNWPFLMLYLLCRRADADRRAMWFSLFGMAVLNVPLALDAGLSLIADCRSGMGAGLYMLFVMVPGVPFLGAVGWGIGRLMSEFLY